jgi:CheY-like chemotaxis protein
VLFNASSVVRRQRVCIARAVTMDRWKAFTRDALASLHILLVEDDPPTSKVFKMILEYTGALVSVADTAEQALRLFDRAIPDVLVSDIFLPEKDGFWLITQLRRRAVEQGGAVPAIAVTGGEYRPEQILAAGFQVYLRKPIEPEVLCQAIAAAVMK